MSDLVGCKLITKFDGYGFFKVHIDKYSKKRGHHIKHDDGDDEWVQKMLVYGVSFNIHMHTLLTMRQDDLLLTF